LLSDPISGKSNPDNEIVPKMPLNNQDYPIVCASSNYLAHEPSHALSSTVSLTRPGDAAALPRPLPFPIASPHLQGTSLTYHNHWPSSQSGTPTANVRCGDIDDHGHASMVRWMLGWMSVLVNVIGFMAWLLT
jgi:hypothetical protein